MLASIRLCTSAALGLLLASTATAAPALEWADVEIGIMAATSAVLIGDSTTNNGTTTNSGGWSNGFCASLSAIPKAYCMNEAQNGATTGSTISSGRFNHSLAYIKQFVKDGRPPFVTVQFGHNDQKIADAASMGANLTIMVDQIRAAGGEPILVTPLCRRTFSGTTVTTTLQPWADETKRIASVKGTKVIDLHARSITYCQAIGADACHRLNRSTDDNTHLNDSGATVFGRIVALLIKAVLPELALTTNAALDTAINSNKAYF